MNLFNQIVQIRVRILGDMPSRIGKSIMTVGAVVFCGGLFFSIEVGHTQSDGSTTQVSIDTGSASFFVSLVGLIILGIGLFMLIWRYLYLIRYDRNHPIILFFFRGFKNMNPELPKYAIPKAELSRVHPVDITCGDSYNPDGIIKDYDFNHRLIQERVEHASISKAYVACIGSVPYVYAMGTLFSGGNISLTSLEHNRSVDKWHLLDHIGKSPRLIFSYKGSTERDSIISKLSEDTVGLAISFTANVECAELPEHVRDSTINIKLSSGFSFDSLSVEIVQDEVVKEISHFITQLFASAKRVDLFIAAQTSVIFKLGRLYQNGMMSEIVVHNYDSKSRSYNWALCYNGEDKISKV